MRFALKMCTLLVAMIVVGSVFGIWLGFSPHSLGADAYVEMQQQMIRALNVKMPLLGAISIALTSACAALARKDRRTLLLLGSAAACFVVMGLVTRFLNQPINAIVIGWSSSSPPAGWQELRDTWWSYHTIRVAFGVAGFLLLSAGLLRPLAPQAEASTMASGAVEPR